MDGRNISVDRLGWCIQGEIKRKFEFTANSGDAADDIGTVNDTAIPGIFSALGDFDKDGVSTTVIGANGDSFVENAEVSFDRYGFVITTGSRMKADAEDLAHRFEGAEKFTVSVNNHETAEADFEKKLAHEEFSKGVGGRSFGSMAENKPSEVAHSSEEFVRAAKFG